LNVKSPRRAWPFQARLAARYIRFAPCTRQHDGADDSLTVERSDAPGACFFGPYLELRPGYYQVEWRVRVDDIAEAAKPLFVLDVCAHAVPVTDTIPVHARDLSPETDGVGCFRHIVLLPSDHQQRTELEFRLHHEQNCRIALESVRFGRIARTWVGYCAARARSRIASRPRDDRPDRVRGGVSETPEGGMRILPRVRGYDYLSANPADLPRWPEAAIIERSAPPGICFYGPFLDLRPGYYRVEWRLRVSDSPDPDMLLFSADTTAFFGRLEMRRMLVCASDLAIDPHGVSSFVYGVRIPKGRLGRNVIEFRLIHHQGCRFSLEALQIARIARFGFPGRRRRAWPT
jgi:hypothetical protein